MTRWTLRILLMLCLGVVTTVGVAWGLALWSDDLGWTYNAQGTHAIVGSNGEVLSISVRLIDKRVGLPLRCIAIDESASWEWWFDGLSDDLPLRPIFPGFIINTLFYAAIWFGAIFGVAALRRAVRKKHRRDRGRCVKCGFDLEGQWIEATNTPPPPGKLWSEPNGCPECGWNREESAA